METWMERLAEEINFTEQELLDFTNSFEEEFVKKKQFIIQPNFPVSYRYYIKKGAFRSYLICKEGQDHTIQFAIDNQWITDNTAYYKGEAAKLFVTALEDSVVFKVSKEKENELKRNNHLFETFFRQMAEVSIVDMQARIISNLTQTAAARYEKYLADHKNVVQLVPQYALASYLGMTTEYLSRLRNKRVHV